MVEIEVRTTPAFVPLMHPETIQSFRPGQNIPNKVRRGGAPINNVPDNNSACMET